MIDGIPNLPKPIFFYQKDSIGSYGGFLKWWYPQNRWFIMENSTIKRMIWGYHGLPICWDTSIYLGFKQPLIIRNRGHSLTIVIIIMLLVMIINNDKCHDNHGNGLTDSS